MPIKYLLVAILYFTLCSNLLSQDVLFSQFWQSNTFLNPALTADLAQDSRYRVLGQYRLKTTVITTLAHTVLLNYEQKILVEKTYKVGIGLSYAQRSLGEYFDTKIPKLALAYHRLIKENQQLSLGLSTDFVNHSGVSILFEAPNTQLDFTGINIGVNWRYEMGENEQFELGVALNNINRPDELFNQNAIPMQFNLYAFYLLELTAKYSLSSRVFYRRSLIQDDLFVGGQVRKVLGQTDNILELGVFTQFRFNDRREEFFKPHNLMGTLAYQYKSLMLQLSYAGSITSLVTLLESIEHGLEFSMAYSF